MSNALAIAGVSAVLKDLLNNGLIDHDIGALVNAPVTVTAMPPDRIKADDLGEKAQLNLFLYQITPNIGWNNVGLPSRDGQGVRLTNRPLALDLHYLLTAYGKKDFDGEILLGYAMQLLHETPVLSRDAIRTALAATSPVNGDLLPPSMSPLLASDLAEQVEQIKISPQNLTMDELSKLWTAFQGHYRPTAAYHVSVVLIESKKSTKMVLPVQERRLRVLPFQRPLIDEVLPQQLEPGNVLTLKGENLRADKVTVSFGDTSVTPTNVTNSRIDVTLPPDLPAGVNSAQIIEYLDFDTGAPTEPHRLFQSNTVPFILTPKLQVPAVPEPAFGTIMRGTTFTVQVRPPVGRDQNVRLLLGNGSIARVQPLPADPATTTSLPFVIPDDFPTGDFFVRVEVAGAQSNLKYDKIAGYTGPKVSIRCSSKCLRTSITLAATPIGVQAQVTVKDENGAPMDASVTRINWTLPDGTTQLDTQTTNNTGVATFAIAGGSGTYILTILNVTRAGSAFDQAQSTIKQTFVKP
jgi:hypothetical protein